MQENFTDEEAQQVLDEAVAMGVLKTVEINGVTHYVNPTWEAPEINTDTYAPRIPMSAS